MPIYEYQCENEHCATRTEKIMNRDERTETIECPHCGREARIAVSSTGAPQFKGRGFYQTDYK